jgi:hypothetical protein
LPYIEPLLTDKNEAARAMAAAAFIMLRAGGGNKKVSKGPVVNTPDASRPSQK